MTGTIVWNIESMEIFDDGLKFGLEMLLLGGGFVLLGLGRDVDERLSRVDGVDRQQVLMEVGKKGRAGFGYPQVGALASGLWVCLVVFGTAFAGQNADVAWFDLSLGAVLCAGVLITALVMLQSRFTLDAMLGLGVVIVLGSLAMMSTGASHRMAGAVHLVITGAGWLVATVWSLSRWGVSPLNRVPTPLLGERMIIALVMACLGVIVAEVVAHDLDSVLLGEGSLFYGRAGIVLLVLGSWASCGQGVFVRSLLGMCLMIQGVLLMLCGSGRVGQWELLGCTVGLDVVAGLTLWWAYQREFGEVLPAELTDERLCLVRSFESQVNEGDISLAASSSLREAHDGFVVAGR